MGMCLILVSHFASSDMCVYWNFGTCLSFLQASNQDSDFQTYELEKMNVNIVAHKGRIPMKYWPTVSDSRDVFICGPGEFGDAAETGLRGSGVSNDKTYREGFY